MTLGQSNDYEMILTIHHVCRTGTSILDAVLYHIQDIPLERVSSLCQGYILSPCKSNFWKIIVEWTLFINLKYSNSLECWLDSIFFLSPIFPYSQLYINFANLLVCELSHFKLRDISYQMLWLIFMPCQSV